MMTIYAQLTESVKNMSHETSVSLWDCAIFCTLPILLFVYLKGVAETSLSDVFHFILLFSVPYLFIFLLAGAFYFAFRIEFNYRPNVLFHGVMFFTYLDFFVSGIIFGLYLDNAPLGLMVNLLISFFFMFLYFTAINFLNVMDEISGLRTHKSYTDRIVHSRKKLFAVNISFFILISLFLLISYLAVQLNQFNWDDIFELSVTATAVTLFLYLSYRFFFKTWTLTSRNIAYWPVSGFLLILNFLVLLNFYEPFGIHEFLPSVDTVIRFLVPDFIMTTWLSFLILCLTDVIFMMFWIWLSSKIYSFLKKTVSLKESLFFQNNGENKDVRK
ncbi:hypothetical protein [Methanolapillus ohkumae]|uniref:Uncharacterized protein n=1 Tax=Methanolapillus ohkumae TaxID=3028298 RepID=A0AA96V4J1_9EURY|nr:hypothetical protein MsAm2_02160 [Methanosarcinaceae archaeon Am2]